MNLSKREYAGTSFGVRKIKLISELNLIPFTNSAETVKLANLLLIAGEKTLLYLGLNQVVPAAYIFSSDTFCRSKQLRNSTVNV